MELAKRLMDYVFRGTQLIRRKKRAILAVWKAGQYPNDPGGIAPTDARLEATGKDGYASPRQ